MNRLLKLSFLFIVVLLFSFCKNGDNDDDNTMMNEELSLTTNCTYTIQLGNQEFSGTAFPTSGNLVCNVTTSHSGAGPMTLVTPGAHISDFDTEFGFYIDKGTFRVVESFDIPSDEEFKEAFAVGTYPFTEDALDGVRIQYFAEDGTRWDSSDPNADQSNSSFKIIEMVSGEFLNSLYVVTRGEFNCNLYNEAGDVRVSSGTVTIQFQNF